MIFKKKGRMIDVGELQKKGKIHSPKIMPKDLDTNQDGFVEVGRENSKTTISKSGDLTNVSSKEYLDVGSTNFSTESNGYSKREVDSKIQQLDSMIYKLEQRIELLERKNGIDNTGYTQNSSSSSINAPSSSGSLIGW